MSSSLPTLNGVLNFREMGGLRGRDGVIADRLLYRSGHLATATDEDVAALATLGLQSVVDLRQDVDKAGDGGQDRLPDGVELIELPVADPAGDGAEMRRLLIEGDNAKIQERYGEGRAAESAQRNTVTQATDPEKQAVYAAFMNHIVQADGPVLFHCSAGKDRAGWGATLVGMALGVADDDLVEHYVLSNVHRPVQQRIDHYKERGIDVEVLVPFLQVDESYIRAALAAVDEGWASREAYLADALGLGLDALDRLRTRLLV